MVAAGIMGLPPTNGVLPQAPMHTHALSVSCDCFFPFLFFPSTHEKVRVRGRRRKFKRAKKTHSFLVSTLLKNKKVAAGERARRIAAAAEVEERQAEAEAEAAAGAAAAAENGGGFGLQRRRPPPPASKKKSPSPPASATTSTTAAALPAALPQHHHHHHPHQPLEPLETRVASFLQYLAILACAFAGPLMRQIPRGAIAGYFAFMALECFGSLEMVDRLRWLCSDASGRASVRRPVPAFAAAAVPASSSSKASEGASSSCPSSAAATAAAAAAPPLPPPAPPPLPPPPPPPPPARWTRAPTKSIAAFTAFQLACVALVYALTWVPVAGILFPVPIMLFVPLRTYVLPRVFGRAQIELLDGP